ncbi:MAG: hypothetical protein ACR2P2_01070 [Nakamurella sp.]
MPTGVAGICEGATVGSALAGTVGAVVLADADSVSAAVESPGVDDATDPDDAVLDVAALDVAALDVAVPDAPVADNPVLDAAVPDAPVADDAVLDAAMLDAAGLDGRPAVADCAVVLASPDPPEHPCATRAMIAVMPTIIPALVRPVACLMHR